LRDVEHAQDHYTIITADSHAGGSHAAYAEYLDPKYRDDFDAWRGRYRNPFKDLGDQRRFRNWDNEMRNSQQEADGVVGKSSSPTPCAVLSQLRALCRSPDARRVRAPPGGHPGPQPLARRFL